MQQAAVVSTTATGAVSEDKSSGFIPSSSSGNFAKISTSRRALLGVALAAPAAIAAPASASSSCWTTAQAAFVKANEAMNAYARDYLAPATARYGAWRKQWPALANINDIAEARAGNAKEWPLYARVQNRHDELFRRRSDAFDVLVACPAPNANAVAYKIEILIADEFWEHEGCEEAMRHLLADLRRIGERA